MSSVNFTGRDAVSDPLTDHLRKGARELLQAAVEAARDDFLAEFAERRTADGRAAVVVIGVNALGEKHLLAIEDGVRESTQSWREVLRGLKTRGLAAPKLAIGDGAMGFWAALEEVFPTTRQQRGTIRNFVLCELLPDSWTGFNLNWASPRMQSKLRLSMRIAGSEVPLDL